MKNKSVNFKQFYIVTMIGALFGLTALTAFAQTTEIAKTETAKTEVRETEKPAALQPVLTDYKGIKIGMSADEVRDKIDEKPKVADKDGFYYNFSDDESAQIVLDENKKVRVILVIYSGKAPVAPKYEDVFGKSVPVTETEGGGVYNLVRYPEAGFWIAYNRTAGDDPTITVTIQKM